MRVSVYLKEQEISPLSTLEDANAIHAELAEVMQGLKSDLIDHRTAALLLYALQIASANVKFTNFEPQQKTGVAIDSECIAQRPLGGPHGRRSRDASSTS